MNSPTRTKSSSCGALVLAALLLGCGGSSATDHTVAISASQKGCSGDSDCVTAYEGVLGCCGNCPNSAINNASYAAYQAAVSKAAPVCRPAPPCVYLGDVACG